MIHGMIHCVFDCVIHFVSRIHTLSMDTTHKSEDHSVRIIARLKTSKTATTTQISKTTTTTATMPNEPTNNWTAFQVGNQVVVRQGRWIREDGDDIQATAQKLKIQMNAGGVLSVWKNACCLVVDKWETNKEYVYTDESIRGGIVWPIGLAISNGLEDRQIN
jgi:hypothetical protein